MIATELLFRTLTEPRDRNKINFYLTTFRYSSIVNFSSSYFILVIPQRVDLTITTKKKSLFSSNYCIKFFKFIHNRRKTVQQFPKKKPDKNTNIGNEKYK